ncbi:MAG: hypothetical protein Q8927_17430 [Bacteroidota bacterium]|nr:hypothetical protein [Bacteroidota bacterium]MDP4217989.1 hypothetical protein [Bacteroidota bacterium]MDP4247612.1 hypothetical protein [Bacteroidota bacterium]MDP4255791.1 hypothetical protein [Bacteroidota bacterium]MDP4260102.1 hypothetical protein [Bacteroidota bacterium]
MVFCLASNLAWTPGDAQTPDSTASRHAHAYATVTLLSGAGFMLFRTNNTMQVSFPYSITDKAGNTSDTVFQSVTIRPYHYPKWFLFPIALEMGDPEQYLKAGFAFETIGNWTDGYRLSLGYGRNLFVNGPGDHRSAANERALLIRPGFQVSYTHDKGDNDPARLGNIDNTDKTIRVFGHIAAPTYSYSDGLEYTTNTTYPARFLEIDYQQGEWALMPEISVMSNPYLHHVGWELSLGYNIPFYEEAGILLVQDDGGGKHNMPLGNTIGLNQPGLSAQFNGRPVSHAPYRFSGFTLHASLILFSKKALDDEGKGKRGKTLCDAGDQEDDQGRSPGRVGQHYFNFN